MKSVSWNMLGVLAGLLLSACTPPQAPASPSDVSPKAPASPSDVSPKAAAVSEQHTVTTVNYDPRCLDDHQAFSQVQGAGEMKTLLKPVLLKFDGPTLNAVEQAVIATKEASRYEVTVEQMLLELLRVPSMKRLLEHYAVDGAELEQGLVTSLEGLRAGNTGKPVFDPKLTGWWIEATCLARLDWKIDRIGPAALIATLLRRLGAYTKVAAQLSSIDAGDLATRISEF